MAVVDGLVSKVLDMLVSSIEQEIRLVAGAEQEVWKLTSNLQSIQAVLIDAERRQLEEAPVQLWLDRLKSVTYDIDDVVDEWSYEIFRESQIKPLRKVWPFNLLSSCYCFPKVVLRHQIAVKIQDLSERLVVIANEKDRYRFQLLRGNNEIQRPLTTSIVDISEVKGREADKEKLLNMLLGDSCEMPKLHLISIVGMGGIGKTTLAKLVYNNERVNSHFEKKIWVCVSDPFDEIRIAIEILESLEGATPNLVALPNIMEKIQESIKGKKVLLVLDDVWNEDPKKWKQLGDCLKCSLLGSRILLTTRNEKVGRIMGCLESNIFRIGLLSEEECWTLFCMIAFTRESREERANLENIGKKIVGRCKGLPLAIRTIAGLLQFKNSVMQWQSVLESEFWDLEEVQRDIIAPLWLSYYDLPSPLKQCFLYCVVFPKDYKMEKDELVELWMAHGYIKATQSKDMEVLGDVFFQNLVVRSLFQDVETEDYFGVRKNYCKMHDMVHDLGQSLVKKECLSIQVNKIDETISFDDSFGNLLHLSISSKEEVRFAHSFYNLKKLRSLLVSTNNLSSYDLDLQKIVNEFTSLRSLRLHRCDIRQIPSDINKLIHLRELDLSGNSFLYELPDTLWELHNLQTLNLNGCERIRSLQGLESLTKLRHLDNDQTRFLLPKQMVRLSGLRRLHWVNIDVDGEEAFSLKDLKHFNQLRGSLAIFWRKGSDSDVEDAKQAHMKDKKHIVQLFLYLEKKDRRKKQHEELIEALNMPPNLAILQINNYLGFTTPSWMCSLTAVKRVQLHDWSNCLHLPPLGKLPCLEDLELGRFERVKKVGAEFLDMDKVMLSSSSSTIAFFPKLTTLKFLFMYKWEEWNDVDGDDEMMIMPCLASLEIIDCYELKALPNFILKKTALNIVLCDTPYVQRTRNEI